MQLADTLGRSMGAVIDVRPLGAEPTPVEKAYADTAARHNGSTHNRPALPSASGPVYLGTCGCRFAPAILAGHEWSTSVVCPRGRRWVGWTVEDRRPPLPHGEPEWTAHTNPSILLTGQSGPPRRPSLLETFRRAYFGPG
jgi:hypothetical protein